MNKSQKPEGGRNRRFLLTYLVVLFSFALVMIFLSYMSQIKAHDQLVKLNSQMDENLETAEGTLKKLESLQALIDTQKDQIASLEEQLKTAQQEIEENQAATTAFSKQNQDLEKKINAYDFFWRLEKAYRSKKYSDARALLAEMDTQELSALLDEDAQQEYIMIKKALNA